MHCTMFGRNWLSGNEEVEGEKQISLKNLFQTTRDQSSFDLSAQVI